MSQPTASRNSGLAATTSFVGRLCGAVARRLAALFHGVLLFGYPRKLWNRLRRRKADIHPGKPAPELEAEPEEKPVRRRVTDTASLVDEFLDHGRFSLLLRPQIIDNLEDEHVLRTVERLDELMALVPAGEVVLGASGEENHDYEAGGPTSNAPQGRAVHVEPVFLDRHPVTNREFKQFVDAGQYGEMAIWDEEVWAAMLDFVDRTGHPGPANWKDGTYQRGQADHPVVGVSWYEAVAYARWCGKRLPTDAEWAKAACWPVALSEGNWQQRKYPWGEVMEGDRANLWSAGLGGTVPVDEFDSGMSIGGLQQMIGNVWEWTSNPYGSPDDVSLTLPFPMRSVRGGAFDTYFDNQATCHFQSGDNPLNRKHNVGFRLAMGVCDVAPRAVAEVYGSTPESEAIAAEA